MNRRLVVSPVTWSEIPHVDDVDALGPNDYDILRDLRDVLVRRGAVDRFGVTLIHRHFDIGTDEVLFEVTDEAARTQTTVVRRRSEVDSQNAIETEWTFERVRGVTVCSKTCDYYKGHKKRHVKVGK